MGLVDYRTRARSRCRICQRGRGAMGEEGDRQRGLIANRHSYWLCRFIFAIHPKWDGRFCCGSGRIWALSPGLWGGHLLMANLEHYCRGSLSSHLSFSSICSPQWDVCVHHVPSSTEFPTLEKGHSALDPVFSPLFREDNVTFNFSHACCEGK